MEEDAEVLSITESLALTGAKMDETQRGIVQHVADTMVKAAQEEKLEGHRVLCRGPFQVPGSPLQLVVLANSTRRHVNPFRIPHTFQESMENLIQTYRFASRRPWEQRGAFSGHEGGYFWARENCLDSSIAVVLIGPSDKNCSVRPAPLCAFIEQALQPALRRNR